MGLLVANAMSVGSLVTTSSRSVTCENLGRISVGFRDFRGLGFVDWGFRRGESRKRQTVALRRSRGSVCEVLSSSLSSALEGNGNSNGGVGGLGFADWGFRKRRGLVCKASTSAFPGKGVAGKENGAPVWSYVIPLRRTFPLIEPFILAELGLILRGWVCTAVAVGALFLTVPQIGNLSNLLAKGDMQQLCPKAGQVLALVMVRSVAQFWQQALLWEAALKITYKLRAHVYERVLNRDMDYFEGGEGGAAAGDVAFRLTAEAEDVGDTVHSLLHMLVPSALQLGAMGFRMVSLSPLLSFATISVVPLMFVVIAMLGEKLRQLSKNAQTSIAGISAYLNEVLPAMFVVKSHAAEACERRRFENLAQADWQAHLGKKRMKAFIPEVITAVYAATAIALFGVGTWVISQGKFDGAGMIAFVTSLVLLIEPIQAMGKAYNELKQGEPAIERLFDLTNFKAKVVEENKAKLEKVAGEVEFCNVGFRYKNTSKWVLNNFSLKVRAGETVALVGPSGSGKSTLAKLLLRLYDPVQGSIRIDGHDILDFDLKSLRKHVAIVPQETTLFTGTVAENIAYGDMSEALDMVKIEKAGRMANADDFIKNLPNGYNTHLGDRATTLSGGQRQRLAIARAVYQGASILILDESTSALDNKSEKLVREALEGLMIDHTVFVIAHRLETVRRADRIFLLDGGELVEEGTHSTLLAKGGQYASLYTMQENSTLRKTPSQTF
ncbi:hypothetical protein M758_UG335500 [Ceratodon purpureus]|nr:hypothetical protein M758_UG335500 [Ceratodon purpureus]